MQAILEPNNELHLYSLHLRSNENIRSGVDLYIIQRRFRRFHVLRLNAQKLMRKKNYKSTKINNIVLSIYNTI
jgi:hypothetical protein